MNFFKIIIGLSNPINKYYDTRHNVGSWYIKILSKKYLISLKKKNKFKGYLGKIKFFDEYIYVFIPNFFMNLNGKYIFSLLSFYNISYKNILIIHDELDLLPGEIKFRYGFGHNGHNGLKSIFNFFKKKKFYRLSIGIGRPNNCNKISSYVLSSPSIQDKKKIINIINFSISFIKVFIKNINISYINKLFLNKINVF
ncbi:aminoacyl-tRNA hydrolase [Buchnera aphidicola]|uniref:aminoacyl-tRNA hydrolase n=1 Tax=Buchnera aphidicola TaxID=9 RepID=UPI0031B86796